MEGNNIKEIDQLFYLKRCKKLNYLNLKYNPVTENDCYYKKIEEFVPLIEELDEELVEEGFFESK